MYLRSDDYNLEMWISKVNGLAYHKRHPELVRHDVVEDRIDRRRCVVENTWYVSHQDIDELHPRAIRRDVIILVGAVYRDQTLYMERQPANEERYDDRDCNNLALFLFSKWMYSRLNRSSLFIARC